MTQISGTFTANGGSAPIYAGNTPIDVAAVITGPFEGAMYLQRAMTPDMSAWEDILRFQRNSLVTLNQSVQTRPQDRIRIMARGLATNKISNGTFASTAGWTAGAGWSIGSGVATRSASASTPNLDRDTDTALVPGASYVVSFDMTRSAGSLTVSLGGGTASAAQSSAGAKSLTLVAGSSNDTLRFIAGATFAGTVDNVVVTPSVAYTLSDTDGVLSEFVDRDAVLRDRRTQTKRVIEGDLEISGSLSYGGAEVTATAAEANDNDISARTQEITAAGAIDLDARHVKITGPTSSTYAVTLAAPTRAGILKIVEMIATTSTNAVTLALTNVVGGTAASSASFDAAGEILVLLSAEEKWVVVKEQGVTLS